MPGRYHLCQLPVYQNCYLLPQAIFLYKLPLLLTSKSVCWAKHLLPLSPLRAQRTCLIRLAETRGASAFSRHLQRTCSLRQPVQICPAWGWGEGVREREETCSAMRPKWRRLSELPAKSARSCATEPGCPRTATALRGQWKPSRCGPRFRFASLKASLLKARPWHLPPPPPSTLLVAKETAPSDGGPA